MPQLPIEQELDAIKTITSALDPLDSAAKQRVLEYATQHLGLALPSHKQSEEDNASDDDDRGSNSAQQGRIADIRTLRNQKSPTSDVQMAAIVAYYLSKLAPPNERKDSITAGDIEKYFEQAGHSLPSNSGFTLVNAKKAGYLDQQSRGKYRLNPVGHNLVVHGLPKSENDSAPGRRRRSKPSKRRGISTATKKKSKKGS